MWLYRSFFSTPVEGSGSGIKTVQSQLSVTVAGAVQSRVLRWEFLTRVLWTFPLQLAAWQESVLLHHLRNACFGEWGELVTQPRSRLSGFRLSSVESWHTSYGSFTYTLGIIVIRARQYTPWTQGTAWKPLWLCKSEATFLGTQQSPPVSCILLDSIQICRLYLGFGTLHA